MIYQLREEGLSIAAIARRVGMDRKTVRKYLKAGLAAPSYGPRAPRAIWVRVWCRLRDGQTLPAPVMNTRSRDPSFVRISTSSPRSMLRVIPSAIAKALLTALALLRE